ncbi:hypothetical protein [Marinobacter sp. SS21]|uniref:hypothetical protein n=1 Tax=Marinobacter sp. SS21 TaxID=2979460 RepID=UPI00232D4EE7|nr:hypothetical protein [Marinobacter sp. SS21]MDC0661772.1 hypothetical protein [Marinobacter sp. SS21]
MWLQRPALFTLIALSVQLTACGGGSDDSLEEAAGKPNTFPPATNALDDFQSGTTGDSNNSSGLAANEVRVSLEVPAAIAPDGEETRRNLRLVTPDRIDVYRSNHTLARLASVDVDLRSEGNGRHVITFSDGQPLGPDVIIEASFGNTVFRSLAADEDRDIKVNPFSEFLIRDVLSTYSAAEFDQVMSCVNSGEDNLCLNKYVWSTLADQVHDFEIEIPSNLDGAGTLALLGERRDFVSYTADMASFALLDSASAGTISASSVDFNSVLLGIELGQSFLEPNLGAPGQWGVRIAQEELLQDENGSAHVYPALTLTSFNVFDINVTSVTGDIPYRRETLVQTAGNDFLSRGNETWDLNTHATAPGAATLQDAVRLVTGRAFYQSITGQDSSRVIGWTRNPFFLDAFVADGDTTPSQVLAGYFSAGKAIELERQGDQLKRLQTLDDHYLSAIELNLARAEDFSLDTLDGKTYNVMTLGLELNQNLASPFVAESAIGTWTVNGSSISRNLTTQVLSRDGSGTVASQVGARVGGHSLTLREAQLSSGPQQIGRLNLDSDGIGASTPDGNLLAFNLDDSEIGDGLVVAGQQFPGLAPTSGSYRVQGVALGLAANSNLLSHYQDATLTLTSSTTATLATAGLTVEHTVASSKVSTPTAMASADIALSYADLGNGQISFTDGVQVLTGFVTADHQSLFLRLVNNSGARQELGLLLATRLP